MKRKALKTAAVSSVVVFIVGFVLAVLGAFLPVTVRAASKTTYTRQGDTVWFGSYPQSKATDEELASMSATPDENGFYTSGKDKFVKVSSADPKFHSETADTDYIPFDDGTQPVVGSTYYFKMEPVEWKVMVDDANAEIIALDKFNPATTAIVNRKFADKVNITPAHDSLATIVKEQQQPKDLNVCSYKTHSSKPMMAVFSEIYYAPDWFAYIDGEKADYIQADYVLRAMVIPAGDHTVEFRCEAPTQHRLDRVTLIISIISSILVAFVLFIYYKRKQTDEKPQSSTKNKITKNGK